MSAKPSSLRQFLEVLRTEFAEAIRKTEDFDPAEHEPRLATFFGDAWHLADRDRPTTTVAKRKRLYDAGVRELEERDMGEIGIRTLNAFLEFHEPYREILRTIAPKPRLEVYTAIRDWSRAFAGCWVYIDDAQVHQDFMVRYHAAHALGHAAWTQYRDKMRARGKSDNPMIVSDESWKREGYGPDQVIAEDDPDYLELQFGLEPGNAVDLEMRYRDQVQQNLAYRRDPLRGGASLETLRDEVTRLRAAWKDLHQSEVLEPRKTIRELWAALVRIGLNPDPCPVTNEYDFLVRLHDENDELKFQVWEEFRAALNEAERLIDAANPPETAHPYPTPAEFAWHAGKLEQLAHDIGYLSYDDAKTLVSFYLCFDKSHPSHDRFTDDVSGQRPISHVYTAIIRQPRHDVRLAKALKAAAGALGAYCAQRTDAPTTASRIRDAVAVIRDHGGTTAETQTAVAATVAKSKRHKSHGKGDANAKLIAALTAHHGYANGQVKTYAAIGGNELSELANVSKGSVTKFWKRHFHKQDGITAYNRSCTFNSGVGIVNALRTMNGEDTHRELELDRTKHFQEGALSTGE